MSSMKTTQVVLIAALTAFAVQSGNAQTARDYFKDLYKAGGLDKTADEYVCFDDRPDLKAFFVYADYSALKQRMSDDGKLAKLSQHQQRMVGNGFLIVREYDRGVPHAEEDVYYREGDTWATDPITVHSLKTPMRMRLNIAQGTLRYQRKVEILNSASKVADEVVAFGRCELVPVPVEQTGK